MDVALYTGNGSTQNISGLGFSPDLVWMKVRSINYNHTLIDSVRGATQTLSSSMTVQEYTEPTGPTAFTSDGWSMNGDVTYVGSVNANGQTYAAWTWDGGSSTVSNTDGSITSSVRANPSAGFSVVTYTGTGSAATVGHGLNAAPGLILIKGRTGTSDWPVYHSALSNPTNDVLVLNTTDSAQSVTNYWNGTNSSVIGLLNGSWAHNTSGVDYVAYCFAPIEGYSAFGSYTGNGSSDGPFVYTGHRSRWILLKNASSGGSNWYLFDTARDTYNVAVTYLMPNSSAAESTATFIDICSNGFKVRNAGGDTNGSGNTIIYACFAENPFSIARAR